MSEFKREVRFKAAYDKRDPTPSKNYGIHGVDLIFLLTKDGEGLEYTILTNWQLPHVEVEVAAKWSQQMQRPLSASCSGHWKKPCYEDQAASTDKCNLTGGVCYSDGTFITDDLFNILLTEGSDGLWKALEARFDSWRPE